MLIISRKIGESILIDNDIEIFVLDIQNDKVKIGIEAPKSINILRKELYETKKSNLEAIQTTAKIDLKALKKIIIKKD